MSVLVCRLVGVSKLRCARRDAAPLDSELLEATERNKIVLTGPGERHCFAHFEGTQSHADTLSYCG